VYPGLGWIVWRTKKHLPEDLIFYVSYLGGNVPTFALNFSRPGAQVLLQYYNFLRLGRSGYERVQRASSEIAQFMAKEIDKMEMFSIFTNGSDMPLITWELKAGYTDKWDLYDLATKLRERGWLVPAYPMTADIEDMTVMRIVFRNGVSMDLMNLLLDDLRNAVKYFDGLDAPLPREIPSRESYHH